jgi:hypothetical protein
LKQLLNTKLIDQKQSRQMFAEMKQLGTLLLDQTQKKSWIERNLAC